MKKIIKIGNAGGYWGDDLSAMKRQLEGGKLDYITMDFLAEITMSILQRQKDKNPELGYASDFLSQMKECLPLIVKNNVKIISNAGGINPIGLAEKIIELAKSVNLKIKVGVVDGDDIKGDIESLVSKGEKFKNMETQESFKAVKDRISSANVYLGADPVVKALEQGCNIIVTGRVTDTGITLAPMIYEFGWALDDWDKMASGIIAGHIIECGAQSSGGNITDWQEVKSFDNIGYPIIEMEASGDFTVTKHPKTGGMVSEKTVKEQLVYEMGDPSNYITPDGVACFNTIQVEDKGKNRVRVSGIKGKPSTDMFKISMSYDDGWKAAGSLLVSGPDVYKKSKAIAKTIWKKLDYKYQASSTSMVGAGSIWPESIRGEEPTEIFLNFGVRDNNKEKVNLFGKTLPALILSGPSGMAVTSGGRPRPSAVVAYWPALMKKENVGSRVLTFDCDGNKTKKLVSFTYPDQSIAYNVKPPRLKKNDLAKFASKVKEVKLRELCYARSGDKGDTCNIGLVARNEVAYFWIMKNISASVVKKFFKGITFGKVKRFELDNLLALNFLLGETLGGGGTLSLMTDPQGKTLSQALLEMKVKVPVKILNSLKKKK